MAVVESSGMAEVSIKWGESMEQYAISKVLYINFFGAYYSWISCMWDYHDIFYSLHYSKATYE